MDTIGYISWEKLVKLLFSHLARMGRNRMAKKVEEKAKCSSITINIAKRIKAQRSHRKVELSRVLPVVCLPIRVLPMRPTVMLKSCTPSTWGCTRWFQSVPGGCVCVPSEVEDDSQELQCDGPRWTAGYRHMPYRPDGTDIPSWCQSGSAILQI